MPALLYPLRHKNKKSPDTPARPRLKHVWTRVAVTLGKACLCPGSCAEAGQMPRALKSFGRTGGHLKAIQFGPLWCPLSRPPLPRVDLQLTLIPPKMGISLPPCTPCSNLRWLWWNILPPKFPYQFALCIPHRAPSSGSHGMRQRNGKFSFLFQSLPVTFGLSIWLSDQQLKPNMPGTEPTLF